MRRFNSNVFSRGVAGLSLPRFASSPIPSASKLVPGPDLTDDEICHKQDYFVPPDDVIKQVNPLFGRKRHVFLKGGVKTGKTSFASLLQLAFPAQVHFVRGREGFKDATVKKELGMKPKQDYSSFDRHDKIVIFDEAHRVWEQVNKGFYQFFVKNLALCKCYVIFMSTTAFLPNAKVSSSPKEVTNEHVINWNFSTGQTKEYVEGYCNIVGESPPSEQSCATLHRFFAGHRGLLASAFVFITEQNLPVSTPQLMHQAIAKMYAAGDRDIDTPFTTRATSLNSKSTDPLVTSIVDCVAGFGIAGPKQIQKVLKLDKNNVNQGIADALTVGGIVPVGGTAAQRPSSKYRISNPFHAERDFVSGNIQLPKPRTAFDILAAALCFFDFRSFVDDSSLHPVQPSGMPHEDNFTAAMQKALAVVRKKHTPQPTEWKCIVESRRSNAKGYGKPDIVFGEYRLENMLFGSGENTKLEEHHQRFQTQIEYPSERSKGLLVVFAMTKSINDATKKMVQRVVSKHAKTPIALVCVGDSLWSWKVFLFEDGKKRPRESVFDSLHAVPGQKFVPQPAAQYWVSVTLPTSTSPEVTNVGSTIQNNKFSWDIDGLKEALLKKLAVELQGKGISHLTVYPPGKKKDGKAAITKMSTPLQRSSEDEPYHVEVK